MGTRRSKQLQTTPNAQQLQTTPNNSKQLQTTPNNSKQLQTNKKNHSMIDGRVVKRARIAAGLTQAGLAQAVGMAAQTIAALEQGRMKWTKCLPQLARVLNKSPGELD